MGEGVCVCREGGGPATQQLQGKHSTSSVIKIEEDPAGVLLVPCCRHGNNLPFVAMGRRKKIVPLHCFLLLLLLLLIDSQTNQGSSLWDQHFSSSINKSVCGQ